MFRTLPLLLVALAPLCHAEPIAVGADAPTMALESVDGGESIDLAATYKSGKTVVVFLRGYPGYQCPACSAQAADYRAKAKDFAEAGLRVVMVYPGPAEGLAGQAEEFTAGAAMPEPLALVLDPDHAMTNAYGLRWDAPAETAYPATLVVERGKVAWIEVSESHGGRVRAAKALRAATRE